MQVIIRRIQHFSFFTETHVSHQISSTQQNLHLRSTHANRQFLKIILISKQKLKLLKLKLQIRNRRNMEGPKTFASLNQSGQAFQIEIKPKNVNGNKRRKVKTWTSEEDTILLRLYQQHPKKWANIASLMYDRNENQCLHRYRRLSQLGANRKIWSAQEDDTVRKLIKKVGKNWKFLSESLGTKTGKQIRERFINKLDPKIKKEEWSDEEDHKLIQLYSELGSKWSEISKKLPGRPENKIKNRFYSFIQKNYDFRYKILVPKASQQVMAQNRCLTNKFVEQRTYPCKSDEGAKLSSENKENSEKEDQQNALKKNQKGNELRIALKEIHPSELDNFVFQESNQKQNSDQKFIDFPSLNEIKLDVDQPRYENTPNDSYDDENNPMHCSQMFGSRIYLKSLIKIEDEWTPSQNRYFRSIHDIASSQQLGHDHDLLYLSQN